MSAQKPEPNRRGATAPTAAWELFMDGRSPVGDEWGERRQGDARRRHRHANAHVAGVPSIPRATIYQTTHAACPATAAATRLANQPRVPPRLAVLRASGTRRRVLAPQRWRRL